MALLTMPGGGRVTARNVNSGEVVAARVDVTATRAERARGLLGRNTFEPDAGLWIAPGRGVHTCGMRFAIDLVALDATGTVIDCVAGLRPWRVRLPRRHVVGVLELPEGSLQRTQTRLGHRLAFEPIAVLPDPVHNGDQSCPR
jgi:uncharacterized membrane protein (UPF0127 family)